MVLFQVGDFFEMYDEDAKQAAELLGLHLTTRNMPNIEWEAQLEGAIHSVKVRGVLRVTLNR